MSLPITAVGPLKVETNPILMESAAAAGCASARAVAPTSQNAVLIFVPSSPSAYTASQMTRPRTGSTLGSVFGLPFLKTRFVRETLGWQQARTAGSLLEPSAHASVVCTIVRSGRGWQEL